MNSFRTFLAAVSLAAVSVAASAATTLAREGGSFTLTQATAVRFGTGTKWNTLNLNPGTYQCNTAVFGDPAYGSSKSCETDAGTTPATTTPAATTPAATTPAATGTTTTLAREGGSFTLTQPTAVRFGAGTRWVTVNLLAGTYQCNTAVFGDPAYGSAKSCEATTAAATTPTTTTPTTTTPTTTAQVSPPCYPWDAAAQATKVTTQPDGNIQWMLASAQQASWIVTWFCSDPGGALPQSISGYRNEIAPFTVLDALRSGTKEQRDAAWNASATCTSNMDPNSASCQKYATLKPLIRAQLAATCPTGCLLNR